MTQVTQPQHCVVEPLAPLVFRSGRPFGSGPADGAQFPLPSSIAGALRARHADVLGLPFTESLRELSALGPLLARRSGTGWTALAPAPADALHVVDEGQARIIRLEPAAALADGAGCDLPDGLLPVVMKEAFKGKARTGTAWWSLADLAAWRSGIDFPASEIAQRGVQGLGIDVRTHVSLDGQTRAGADGKLFQTSSLDFSMPPGPDESLVLLARAGFDVGLREGGRSLLTLGGEGRLSRLHVESGAWPAAPAGWARACLAAGGVSVTLATPAIFSAGWRPGWSLQPDSDGFSTWPGSRVRLRLCAVAVQRWLPVSGWDMQKRCPRASRKAAAAGTTLWFELAPGVDAADLETLWLSPASDDAQDSRDGFGLAVPGCWHPVA